MLVKCPTSEGRIACQGNAVVRMHGIKTRHTHTMCNVATESRLKGTTASRDGRTGNEVSNENGTKRALVAATAIDQAAANKNAGKSAACGVCS